MVTASPDRQIERAVARGGITREEAEARVRAQLSTEEKARVATYVIDNDGPVDETERQVDALLKKLRALTYGYCGSGKPRPGLANR